MEKLKEILKEIVKHPDIQVKVGRCTVLGWTINDNYPAELEALKWLLNILEYKYLTYYVFEIGVRYGVFIFFVDVPNDSPEYFVAKLLENVDKHVIGLSCLSSNGRRKDKTRMEELEQHYKMLDDILSGCKKE